MAEPDPYVASVPDLLAQLQTDPVFVAPVMGLGRTTEVDAALTAAVTEAEDAGQPVYVALVGSIGPSGDGEDMIASRSIVEQLADELDEDAWIYVTTSDQADPGYLNGPNSANTQEVYDALDAAAEAAQELAPEQLTEPAYAGLLAAAIAADGEPVPAATVTEIATSLPWTAPPAPPSPVGTEVDEVVMASVFGGLLVAAIAWRAARSGILVAMDRSASATRAAAETHDLEALPGKTSQALDHLAGELAQTPDHPRAEDATSCRVLAEHFLGSEEVLDRVGALVLARTGQGLLETGRTYRPCLVNPLHGEARRTAAVRTAHGQRREVPVCTACAQDGPGDADWLTEAGPWWRRPRPYVEGDTVWARSGFGALDDALWASVWADRRTVAR